jgi:diadenosine tetraphosphate (Ap4A) HIT family hydrolase
MAAGRDCVFCREGLQTPVIREARFWQTAINRNQNLLGKAMICLRRHSESVDEISAEEWAELRDEVKWITERIRIAFAPDHFNYSFLMNADPHVHLHVIPRYVGVRSLAGVEFTDPDFPGSYREPRTASQIASPAVIEAVTASLTEDDVRPPVDVR